MVAGKEESVRSMCRKGFGRAAGDDHRYFEYIVPGCESVCRTYVSHGGGKDLTENLIREMAKDCHLKPREFFAFVKCQMSAEKYRQILIDKGIIPAP
jgi:hypothetical protein